MNKTDFAPINIHQIRFFIVIGTMLLGIFMLADLSLLPPSLHDTYLTSRISMQFPMCVAFLVMTFLPVFSKIYQSVLTVCMLSLIYINLWFIMKCWQQEQYVFPYEGTVMYSLFTLFVFRMKFSYAVFFSIFTLLGFALLILIYPIYDDRNGVNFGFVLVGIVVGLMGLYQIEKALHEVSNSNLQLTHLSQTDYLTSILNRGSYETRFSDKLALNKRYGNTMCVFFIDLDHFKDYNDGYGHLQGDKVIKIQAQILTDTFRRATDIIARYGGEEFVVVVSDVTVVQCKQFAQQILSKWKEKKVPHKKGKGMEQVSCSVGFYFEKVDLNSEKEEMVKKADEALYKAKQNGRNCFVQF